jgi:hypothetical protein
VICWAQGGGACWAHTVGYRRPQYKREVPGNAVLKYCGCFKISILNSDGDLIHVCLIVGDEVKMKQIAVYFLKNSRRGFEPGT